MGEVLYAPVTSRKAQGRGADRRRGAPALLQSVIGALGTGYGLTAMRQRFEHELKTMVRARAVAVYEGPPAGLVPPAAMSFEVPGLAAGRGARIEVTFEPGRTLDGWTCELLDAATHVAALVLELERASGRPPQFARPRRDGAAPLVGSSPAMRQVRDRIEKLAATDFTILVEGESGTGKELVARQIHDLEPPSQGPVRRRQLRRDCRDAAGGGAVRHRGADRHGCAGPARQVRARRTRARCSSTRSRTSRWRRRRSCCALIQDLSVERVGGTGANRSTSASSSPPTVRLAALVGRRQFRLDLYYRLARLDIQVPPLRDRREDVPELARYFLGRHSGFRPLRLSSPRCRCPHGLRWPGNVRELERVMERAVALAGVRLDRAGGSAARAARRLHGCPPAVAALGRDDARVGQPVRAPGAGSLREQQAARLPRARDLVPHAERLLALSA